MDYLESRYRARREVLSQLFPWDDPNYGVDEQWAVVYPRGAESKPGDVIDMELQVTNHSPGERSFDATIQLPNGLSLVDPPERLKLAPRAHGAAKFRVRVESTGGVARPLSVDIRSDGMDLRRWADALIHVAP